MFYTCVTCYAGGSNACLTCNQGSFLYGSQCVNPCPRGYWGDTDLKCKPCHSSCATCSGGSGNDQCTSCHANYYLSGGQCLSPCLDGYWEDSDKICKTCWTNTVSPFSCKTCNGGGNSDCQSCDLANGHYLYPNATTGGGQCLSVCPHGYWANPSTGICESCWGNSVGPYFTCETCSGPNNNQCLTCKSGTFLHLNQCLDPCPTGFWGDTSSNTCKPCWDSPTIAPFTCLTCNSPSSGGCTSCNSGHYLYPSMQGQCLERCPDGFFANATSGACESCWVNTVLNTDPRSCKTCASGPKSSECTSCTPGTFLHPNTGGQCVLPCPDGFWQDIYTHTCRACWSSAVSPYSCATCDGAHSENCLTCNPGSYLHNGQCINPCPDGFWGDNSTLQCKPCSTTPFPCKTCDAGTSSNCSSCNPGTFLYPMSYGSCLDVCPDGFYADNSDWKCKPCYSSGVKNKSACATCIGPLATNCTTCFASTTYYSIYYSPVDNSCVRTCPGGYYADTSPPPNNQCRKCYQYNPPTHLSGTCATCSGPDSYQCLSCNSSQFLDSTTSTCVNSCPTGWWGNSSSSKCEPCFKTWSATQLIQNCFTCNGPNSTNCTSCSSGSFYYTPNSSCLLNCPTVGYWEDTFSNECKPCYEYKATSLTENTCVTCNGSNSDNCLSCNSTTFLDLTTNRCVNICPDGYYEDNATNLCKSCYEAPDPSADIMKSCKTCSGPAASDCQSCSSGIFLFSENNTCLAECPDGWYRNGTANTCNRCYQNLPPSTWGSCATCTGPLHNNCQSCVDYFYNPAANTCESPCSAGTYLVLATKQCAPCFLTSSSDHNDPKSCFTCNGPLSTNCLSCPSGSYYYPKQSICVTTCPIGTYRNITDICDSCFVSASNNIGSCVSCNGPNPTNCTSCSAGYYLDNQTSSCVTTCPDGTYPDNQAWTCQPCFSADFETDNDDNSQFSCETCDGPLPTQCLSCASGLALFIPSRTCTNTCPCENGYFYDSTTRICDLCHPSCSFCTGPTDSDCKFDTNSESYCLLSGSLVQSNRRAQVTGVVAQGGSHAAGAIVITTNILSGGVTMGATTVLSSLSLFELYQYFNVNYTSNVAVFFQYMSAGNLFNVANFFVHAANPDPQLLNKDSIIQGDNKFSTFHVSNLFLVNAGADLSLLISLLCVVPVVVLICLCIAWSKETPTSPKSKFEKFMNIIKKFFVWNFILSCFMGAYVHILLSACVQIRYLVTTNNYFANFSALMSLVVFLGYLLFLGFLFYVSRSNRFAVVTATQNGLPLQESIMILRNEEQETEKKQPIENLKSKYWAFALCSRNFVLVLIISMLSNAPIAQCALSMLLNIAFFVIVVIRKFSASRIKRVIMRTCEAINVLIPFSFLIYGGDDRLSATSFGKMSIQGKISLGWFIIVIISFSICLNLVYALIEMWNIIWQFLRALTQWLLQLYLGIKAFILDCIHQWRTSSMQPPEKSHRIHSCPSSISMQLNIEEMAKLAGSPPNIINLEKDDKIEKESYLHLGSNLSSPSKLDSARILIDRSELGLSGVNKRMKVMSRDPSRGEI